MLSVTGKAGCWLKTLVWLGTSLLYIGSLHSVTCRVGNIEAVFFAHQTVSQQAVEEGVLQYQYHFIDFMHLMFQLTTSDFYSGQLVEILISVPDPLFTALDVLYHHVQM